MKPIVYLAAFQHGEMSLDTLVPDEPISVPNGGATKWISNYDGRFKGLIPIRQALAESRNAVAIWIARQVGIDNVLRTAHSLGVLTRLQPYATTALGAASLAGLTAGVWHSPQDLQQSRSFTRFEPSDAQRANGCHAGGRRAVRPALPWARDDD